MTSKILPLALALLACAPISAEAAPAAAPLSVDDAPIVLYAGKNDAPIAALFVTRKESCICLVSSPKNAAVVGKVLGVSGEVTVFDEAGPHPAKPADRLAAGDTVTTGAQSSVKLQLGNDCRARIAADLVISILPAKGMLCLEVYSPDAVGARSDDARATDEEFANLAALGMMFGLGQLRPASR